MSSVEPPVDRSRSRLLDLLRSGSLAVVRHSRPRLTFEPALAVSVLRRWRHGLGIVGLWIICFAGFLILSGPAWAAPVVAGGSGDGVTDDIFDISQGTIMLGNSDLLACCGGSRAENTFGGMGGVEAPHTLFFDGFPAGAIDFINFQTATPVALTGYSAILADDSDNPANPGDPNRGSSSFSLFSSPDATFSAPILISSTPLPFSYATNFGTNAIQITDTFAPVTAQFFRLEITRTTAGGPRIRELDGIGTVVPEPASVCLVALGALALLGRGARWVPRV